MTKKFVFILFLMSLIWTSSNLNSQTLSQIGFVVKEAIPGVENIAIIFEKPKEQQIMKEAQTASLVTRKKFHLFGVSTRAELSRALQNIGKIKNTAVVVVTNESTLNRKGIKYITQKINPKKIPVITNRDKDTLEDALLCVVEDGDSIKTHVNKLAALELEITLSDEFLSNCVVDVE